MEALLCILPACPGFQTRRKLYFLEKKKVCSYTEKVQKCLETCSQQGNCAINKLFSWNSQGTEEMNTLIEKKDKKIPSVKV